MCVWGGGEYENNKGEPYMHGCAKQNLKVAQQEDATVTRVVLAQRLPA